MTRFSPLIVLAMMGLTGAAHAAPVSGMATFGGGLYGDWTISWTSPAGGLVLQQATITLGTGDFFDTTINSPGSLLWQDLTIPVASAAATGYSSALPSSAGARNGSTWLTLSFTDFDPGETFSFGIDVDQSCSGWWCGISLPHAWTDGLELAGATVDLTFGGTGYLPYTISSTYANVGDLTAKATFRGDVEAVPEPATFLIMGAGLAGIGLMRRFRIRA